MVNPAGNALSRLIKDRSYVKGEANTLQRRLKAIRINLEALETERIALAVRLEAIRQRLQVLDEKIQGFGDIPVELIRGQRKYQRRSIGMHGSRRAELVKFLLAANRSVSTVEVRDNLAPMFGLPLDTVDQRRLAQRWAHDMLKNLMLTGAIAKQAGLTNKRSVCWIWVGR